MGFWKRKSKEKTKEQKNGTVSIAEELTTADYTVLKKEFIEESCDQVVESTLQAQELKAEFQAVTSYISDIQKIEGMDREDRELVNDLARKILTLSKDRERYKKGVRKIKDIQYQNLAKFEESIPSDLKKMSSWESYSSVIQNDLKYLESEKTALLHQKEDVEANQKTLSTIGITTSVLSVLLFMVFLWINIKTKANMQLPFMLTVAMDAAAAAYIFLRSKENKRETAEAEKKLNRAILLLNKVKIKYINNTNALDYCYAKYMVDSQEKLSFLWQQYKKEREDENQYKLSKDQMEYYSKELTSHLKEEMVSDSKIWAYQLEALLDKAEMDKVSEALFERRQKLKERIEQNNRLKEKCIEEIEKFTRENDENKVYVAELLKKKGIALDR
ncbi:hypothetical protein [Anaerocolumna xylanovorans]|uniref:Uncharacterized protein n=1 Tax=Anaerocolumna xylanovorans DSM 12503 TaxID=1121345 RepID=A0A1M7YHD4_9FIRM|nr:hypothetical protein [Anaerocolumna xylanovorans]SHO51928.1 hypothetical protein SAMN02745217_03414 [Anaerocolumna xylanovorans DSM 12503]